MQKIFRAISFLSCAFFALVSSVASAEIPMESDSIVVIDDLDHQLKLKAPARRVISLSPHLTENVFTIGGGDFLVGVSAFSDFPKQAQLIENVGDFQALNIEKIISLKPDLILIWADGSNYSGLSVFEELGIPIYWSQPKNLDSIAHELKNLGVLFGLSAMANREAESFLQQLNQLKHYANQPAVKTFFQVWDNPLQTINNSTLIGNIIDLCGGENIFADAIAKAPLVSIETVIAKNPTIIIGTDERDGTADWIEYWQKWQSISAVANQHIYSFNADHLVRHTTRVMVGVQEICQALDTVRSR